MTYQQARYEEPLLMELARPGRSYEPSTDLLPAVLARTSLDLPDLPEPTVVRHFTRLSQMTFGIDSGFYPLGSCTMKYNAKFLEELAQDPKAARTHPYQDESTVQGNLQILYELQGFLAEISGMDTVSLQPAAGAQGEFTGILMARAFHQERGEIRREIVLPDSAHGTNFATAGMLGYTVVTVPSREGVVDLDRLEAAVGDRTEAFMITNPNTLGIFEPQIREIAQIVHQAGALLYYDGANFNAILGKTNPGRMGFDIVHFNLHKTFSTPHGGGGPGAGPVGARESLAPFLPKPVAAFDGKRYYLDHDRPRSIGKVRAFYGNFGMLLRAYAYILFHGVEGLTRNTDMAVLNANYLKKKLAPHLEMPGRPERKHEFVVSGKKLREKGISTMDFAKRLIDYGYHPPTVYFPGLVEEAIMIEPTETESKETLDRFAEDFLAILEEDPALIRSAPLNASVSRVDEVGAARTPILSWRMAQTGSEGHPAP